MKYSFIKPKPKHILKKLTKIWIFYLLISFSGLFSLNTLIQNEANKLVKNQNKIQTRQSDLRSDIANITLEKQRLLSELGMLKNIVEHDKNLNGQINNIMSMVPDHIVISKMELEKDKLYIKGMTPNKEIFINSLLTPLRSIFDTSNANFYNISNGWYTFESISKIKK